MKFRILLVLVSFCISHVLSSGSSSTGPPIWTVGDHDDPCIMLKGDITLNLTYNLNDGSQKWVSIPVNSSSHVSNESSCHENVVIDTTDGQSYNISSQKLKLDLATHGWSVTFYFSTDKKVHGSDTEFVMYWVTIKADYHAMSDKFPNANSSEHLYSHPVKADGDPFGVQDSVYADTKYSYFCPSSQMYHVVDSADPKADPDAQITFKNFQVQAYADSSTFLPKEICPEDEVASDEVPVIVGGCLAGLVLITLVVYLIYRCRLPPSVLYLTNPNSHFEDLAFDNKGHHIDEEEDEHSHEHGHSHNHSHHVHYNHQSTHKIDHLAEITPEHQHYSQSESSRYSHDPSYE